MRCHDAKLALTAQRDSDLAQSESLALQEHLKQCPACRAHEQHLQRMDSLFCLATPTVNTRISTERIMLAIQQQKRISQQLEDMRKQQRFHVSRLRIIGPSLVALVILGLSSAPLLLVTVAVVQPDLMVKTLMLLSDLVSTLIVFVQYLQAGLTLVTRNNWLLSATALVLVVIMGMWLRLMRYPQEA
jgi:predicted anti-sigma-YlaC factor YlaD